MYIILSFLLTVIVLFYRYLHNVFMKLTLEIILSSVSLYINYINNINYNQYSSEQVQITHFASLLNSMSKRIFLVIIYLKYDIN